MAGVDLPVTPERREIVVTEPILGLDPRTPFTIDFASTFYFHAEGPGLLMGMSDPDLLPAAVERRTPTLSGVGIASGWAGLYENTPDHNALIGQAEGVDRLLYATGFSGHGFLMGPAVGEVVRDLVLGRPPVVAVRALDVRRFVDSGVRPELNIV
jgi:sarcosine oxidase subunit beta